MIRILAISGSSREESTNTAMLQAISTVFKDIYHIEVYNRVADLPVFNPDLEGRRLPDGVAQFAALVDAHDALIISSPEYVHAIPGGLKNAIDWLVSRSEITGKPIAILHASYRGDDMLAQLRLVLSTLSERFCAQVFLRLNLLGLSPEEVRARIALPENVEKIRGFLSGLSKI